MTRAQYDLIEGKMLACTEDSAHDREHIYRVLHLALELAATEPGCDREVLAAACLLHDIGRPAQFADIENRMKVAHYRDQRLINGIELSQQRPAREPGG